MKSRFTILMLSVLTLVAVMGMASAATVFSDNFDDGDLIGWTVTNWSNSGTQAESSDTAPSTLSRTISTSGSKDVIVKYDRKLEGGFGSGDSFKASWSTDGVTFNTLEETSVPGNDTSFVSRIFNLPSSANNNASFQLKFECSTNALSEFCKLDNVVVEGTITPTEILACEATGNPGELKVKQIDFKNNGMDHKEFGDDDQWFPLDDIEVEIEIKNDGNEDVDDIEVEWGLWDTKKNEWAIDLSDEKDFNLKDGKDEILTISFDLEGDLDVDLEDLSDGENYLFYVTATGTVDDVAQSPTCASDSESVEIVIESNFVVIDNIQIPEVVQCGETVSFTADVWNIGDSDQDEVSVDFFGRESALDFRKNVKVGDIDKFDKQEVSFTFEVPKGIEEKFYGIVFEVLDEDEDIYENDFDDDPSKFTVPVKVESCSGSAESKVSISASLESEAKAGKQLVVKSFVTNNDDELKTFTVSAAGFVSWASTATADLSTLVLGSGESREVRFTFDVLKDAEGTQNFFVEVLSGDEVTRQPVSVTIEPSSGFTLDGNLPLLIGAFNVILVIIIIFVAVRVARR